MDPIVIHTGQPDFLLIDRITEVGPSHIRGERAFADAPLYLGVEACAQLGALHVRHLIRFERHAFLLKIRRCELPHEERLKGRYTISGTLISRSAQAFAYHLSAERDGHCHIEGEFLFATVAYDRKFDKERLQDHYQKVFSCLQSGSERD